MHASIKKIQTHLKENRNAYIVGGIGLAGITALIMRDVIPRHISHDVIVTAGRDAIVTRENVVNNISYVFNDRQGPPSWVVKCLETGQEYASQRAAALDLGISESNISRYLNGHQSHAQGYTFDRLGLSI